MASRSDKAITQVVSKRARLIKMCGQERRRRAPRACCRRSDRRTCDIRNSIISPKFRSNYFSVVSSSARHLIILRDCKICRLPFAVYCSAKEPSTWESADRQTRRRDDAWWQFAPPNLFSPGHFLQFVACLSLARSLSATRSSIILPSGHRMMHLFGPAAAAAAARAGGGGGGNCIPAFSRRVVQESLSGNNMHYDAAAAASAARACSPPPSSSSWGWAGPGSCRGGRCCRPTQTRGSCSRSCCRRGEEIATYAGIEKKSTVIS